ncbi:hypothetical protein ACFVHB_37225 [Kitasatospora sp. NPDC127111]|uniref:hypothetical protein n=1 Tax=Kitasatospora sp. NPDC127111 TaxID=3345363 RepID=UPI0036346FBF
MNEEWSNPAYVPAYDMLLELEKRLEALRRVGHAGGVDPRGTTALHAVRLAAAILQPVVPGTEAPPFPDDTARLLELIANWSDAALDLGEFAPAGPVLRVIPGGREGRPGSAR